MTVLGEGIFTVSGAKWKHQRKIASRMFTQRGLQSHMFDTFVDTSDRLLIKLQSMSDNDTKQQGINIFDMFMRTTFDAFSQIAFGLKLGNIEQAPQIVPFTQAFDRGLSLCVLRIADPWWRIKRYFNFGSEKELKESVDLLDSFVYNVIKQHKTQMKKDLQETNAKENKNEAMAKIFNLVSMFVSAERDNENEWDIELNDKMIRDIILSFIIAGRDTTACLLSWFIYCLCDNPQIEEELMQEFAQYSATPNYDDFFNDMPYLEACLIETLRLYPSVPGNSRQAMCDVKIPKSDIIVRKGDSVIIAPYAMGRCDWLWANPLEFDPTRFLNNDHSKVTWPDANKYPAFNLAPRYCLGKNVAILEAKTVIFKLLSKYQITKLPKPKVVIALAPTLHMQYGMNVRIQPK